MKMVIKSFSLGIELWEAAMAKANKQGEKLSVIIRNLLRRWLDGEI
jgi:hypothetical protein